MKLHHSLHIDIIKTTARLRYTIDSVRDVLRKRKPHVFWHSKTQQIVAWMRTDVLLRKRTYKSKIKAIYEQEGQHPLTGHRAANFRLLANQWAERRLVKQWRHGCRAMRRSVYNAGASNAGRSLCIQIWMERSYPLPIYWYHSKGNWLRYNFAADSFYTYIY